MRPVLVARRFSALFLLGFSLDPLCATGVGQTPPKLASAKPAEVGIPVAETHSYKEFNDFGQIWEILQDKRGIMYFGHGGPTLLEYDGVTWRKIAMPGTQSRSMDMDSSGRIWVGTVGDFGYLAPDANGTLQYVSLNDKIPIGDRKFTVVFQTLVTPQGVFFRTFEKIFRWDSRTIHVWSAAHGQRFQALSLVNGRVYTSQNEIGLEEIVGDEIQPLPGGDAYKNSNKLFLYPYSGNQILVSERKGLLTFYDGKKSFPFKTQADDFFRKTEVFTSIVLPDGGICVTTIGAGAVILDHDGRLRQFINKGDGLLDADALGAFVDRDGALWIGGSYGVTRVEINSPVSFFSKLFADDAARFNGSVYAILEGVGTSVSRLATDPSTHEPTVVPIKSPTQSFSFTLFKDPSRKTPDQLLVATNDGPYRLQGDELVPAMPGMHGPQEQNYGFLVSKKNPNRVFIGYGNGLGSMRWDGQSWINEGRLPNVIYESRNLAEDLNGVLWVAGLEGRVLRVEVADTGMQASKMESIGYTEGLPRGPTGLGFAAGDIYVSAVRTNALFRWDGKGHRFVIDNRFLLPLDGQGVSPSVFQLPDGSTWTVNSSDDSRRLARINRQPDGSWKIDEETYKPLIPFSLSPAFVDADGSAWFGGEYLIRFSPHGAKTTPLPFPTVVRQIRSGAKTVFGGANIPGAGELRLPAGTDALSFEFAALNYQNPENTTYQYILEGADKDWSVWGKRTEATYGALGPGSYRLRVRSRAGDGRLGEEGSYSFIILPPWYRTKAAYLIYVLLLAVLGLIGWQLISRYERAKARRRTEVLEAEARALEATVNERTEEIRTQATEIAAQKESIELLSEIGKEITASLDLNTILFKLYQRVNQIVDASVFGVGLYHPEKHLIEYSLAIENGKRYAPYTRSTDDKNQFAVWCIDHRQPILLNDVDSESSKYLPSYTHTGIQLEDGSFAQPPASMIYLPLIAQERVLGVLSIQSFKRNAYTEQHLMLLENLAAYTTIALDNAHAYMVINEQEHSVRERAAELVTINRITQALATQLDTEGLIQLVGDQIRELFRAPIAYVALFDRSTMMLHFPYTYGEDAPSRPFGQGLTSQIIRSSQPLLINEDMEGNRARLGVEHIGRKTASYLGVPIPSGGQVIGVISVQSTDQEGRFTEADQRLLSTIASAVGVAFHNAKLFEEARQARAAAEEADAAKSSFLSTVSHELRTPLTSVLGFAKIIRRRLEERLFPLIPEDDRRVQQAKIQVLENLNVVVSEGERLTKLIDDVLDLAKIEAGKFTWNIASVSIGEVIERAVSATASLFEAKKLRLVRDVEPDLPNINGDQDRLIQVVINLISNAVKFTDAGSIVCSAHLEDAKVVVSVKDSGIGISPADQPKVFERFKQVGDTLTDKPKGTGLGLPICKEIVEYHGGTIWVDSIPGQGSTFSFTLPVPEKTYQMELLPSRMPVRKSIDIEALVRQLREKVATHQPRTKSVLVVDDDANIRSLLSQELTEAGYTVRLADDGRKALALIREDIPGLVILDVMMPEMNGFDVAAVLKNDPATMDIPIIILSIVEDKERGFRLGVDRYLTKPIDTASLFHEVDALLDQGKSRKKVMVVDEDATTLRSITDVLQTRGYQVVESNGADLVSRAVSSKPDIIILNSLLSSEESVRALRFEKGMEDILFLIYQ